MPTEDKVVSIAPRSMSREDRRIIFAKLNDIYVDEKVGYAEGWTDQRVSEDLNVPRKWVEDIRKENFGDVRDNEEIRRFVEKVDGLTKELNEIQGLLNTVNARSAALVGVANKLRPLVQK